MLPAEKIPTEQICFVYKQKAPVSPGAFFYLQKLKMHVPAFGA